MSASCRRLNYHRRAGKTFYIAAHTNETATTVIYESIAVSLTHGWSNCVPQLFASVTVLNRLLRSYPTGKCSTVYNVRSPSNAKWPVQFFLSLCAKVTLGLERGQPTEVTYNSRLSHCTRMAPLNQSNITNTFHCKHHCRANTS